MVLTRRHFGAKASELVPFKRTGWTALLHISLVELLRTQLQILTSPEGPIMVKKMMSSSFNKKDEFKTFIDQSQFDVDLSTLDAVKGVRPVSAVLQGILP